MWMVQDSGIVSFSAIQRWKGRDYVIIIILPMLNNSYCVKCARKIAGRQSLKFLPFIII